MNRYAIILFSITLMACNSGDAPHECAATQVPGLRVTVTDTNGASITTAKVQVFNEENDEVTSLEVKEDSFEASLEKDGIYQVVVEADGFATQGAVIELNRSELQCPRNHGEELKIEMEEPGIET